MKKKTKLFFLFLITLILFLTGVLIGSTVYYRKENKQLQEDLTESLIIRQELSDILNQIEANNDREFYMGEEEEEEEDW